MKTIVRNWTFIRVIRLILGIFILIQGITARDTVYSLLGVLLTLMAVANIGCCGVNGCAVPATDTSVTGKAKDITYEEVV